MIEGNGEVKRNGGRSRREGSEVERGIGRERERGGGGYFREFQKGFTKTPKLLLASIVQKQNRDNRDKGKNV